MERGELIAYANDQYDVYQAAVDVQHQLEQVDITLLVGYSGAGKDTLRRNTGLHVVVSDTIRSPRENNGQVEVNGEDYWFRGDEIGEVYAELEAGEYVQYATGPARNSFYGTRIQAYPKNGPALLDVVSREIETMRKIPFKSNEAVFITAPSYQVWMDRWARRGFGDEADTLGRINEAKQTIEAVLDTEGVLFVVNDELEAATHMLSQIATRREHDRAQSQKGRLVAEQVLRDLQAA